MTIEASVQRILAQKSTAIRSFYDRFLAACPDAHRDFLGVDLEMQALMLTMALVSVADYHLHGHATTENYLRVLGHRHDQAGIDRRNFATFRRCLVETLAEILADDWSAELERDWTAALDKSIAVMLEGYGAEK